MPAYGWGGMGRICGKKDTSGVPSVVYGYVQTSAHRDGMLHRASEISASLLGKARRTLCHKLCHSDLCEASVQSFRTELLASHSASKTKWGRRGSAETASFVRGSSRIV